MKKLSTNIINENGEIRKITVFVEDETAATFFSKNFIFLRVLTINE